jgi:hypothetical protein
MAMPAASSLALLILRPEDRRCKETCNADCEVLRLRWAFSDAMLVLMTCAMADEPLCFRQPLRYRQGTQADLVAGRLPVADQLLLIGHVSPLAQRSGKKQT